MRRLIPSILLILCVSCSTYDDSEIKATLQQHESRLTQLESLCSRLNSEISSLQGLVDAISRRDYVTGVAAYKENGVEIGYIISFANASPIVIRHGTNGHSPEIGVRMDSDGKYYWTLDGQWLLDASGKKRPVSGDNGTDGVTPVLKVQDGFWYVSYDNGKSWTKTGQATGADGHSPEIGVRKYSDGKYYWTLDGEWLTDAGGNKLPVHGENGTDGATPVLKIQDGFWYVSYDNGDTWVKTGQATGADGHSPVISVRLYSDGKYYWTLDGEWLTDAAGNKLPVHGENGTDGATPVLKIQDGFWFVSYDGGNTWEKVGQATGTDGDSFFKSVVETDDAVVLTLTDGTVITLEKKKKLSIVFDTSEGLGILPGEKRTLAYTITGGTEDTVVKAFGQNGWYAKAVAKTASSGTIEVRAPEAITDDEIIVLVSDGESTTIMRTISFEGGVIHSDVQSVTMSGAGETVTVDLESNLAIAATSSATWLTYSLKPATRALTPYTLTLSAGKNLSEEERVSTVKVSDESGKVVHTIVVVQGIFDAYENYVDLSGGGETANCYLINKAGEYMFPIIKGNGSKGVILSGDTAEIPDAADAAVVWQDATIVASVGIHNGYVVFETDNTWRTGNAVLAVKDAQGTILWSWHIWSTGYVLGTNDIPVYNHSKSRLYKMMARTLGENGSKVLFYQFGRKDPFPAKKPDKVGSAGSLDASIRQPDTFFARSGSDWCTSTRTDWWDAGCKSNNYSSTTASTLKGNKTIYDPCPAGYRVPPDDAFTNFTTTGTNTESSEYINSYITSETEFYGNNFTYPFYTGNGSNTVSFRAYGGLNAATGSLLNYVGYFYGAHPSFSSTSRALVFYGGTVLPQCTDYSRALAAAIRPVRDEVSAGPNPDPDPDYESTDYSQDGTMVQIKKHSVGTGIKLLIVGDGFTDKDIANGTYDASMKQASDYFFNIEPFKSFQNRFDVVNMRVVSRTSIFDSQKRTAFQAVYEGGSHISGNLSAAYNRAITAFGSLEGVVIIVVMNSTQYAGTCYMAGNTVSVAFCPMSTGTYYPFETVVHHEAGGHGFANLGDEYFYGGTIPDSQKNEIASSYSAYGWYPNLDCTSDRSSIRWSQFLSSEQYSSSAGVYEGGYGYSYGVYRPSNDSCMNNMYGVFNAPSRYAIYKRIMERSGDTWSWDKFVAYDSVNRGASVAQDAHVPIPEWAPRLDPPVAVNLEDYLDMP